MPRLSRLDDARVLDAAGRCIGRVHDLRTRGGAGADAFEIASLVYAGPGLLERLGLGRGRRDRVPWERVERIEASAVHLRNDVAQPP